jgi:hypothetical protein
MTINNATTNFGLMHLEGSDTAGHNSINALITDIDNELYAKVAVPNMIMIFQGVVAPSGWTIVSPAGFPSIPAGYVWIKKD